MTGTAPIRMLRELDIARRRAAITLFSDLPLQDPAQHILLFLIEDASARGQKPSQRELATSMKLCPATVTASLKVLERLELIRRTQDEKDQRINRVSITEQGRITAQTCRKRMEQIETAMVKGFTSEQRELMENIFSGMICNLKAFEADFKGGDSV